MRNLSSRGESGNVSRLTRREVEKNNFVRAAYADASGVGPPSTMGPRRRRHSPRGEPTPSPGIVTAATCFSASQPRSSESLLRSWGPRAASSRCNLQRGSTRGHSLSRWRTRTFHRHRGPTISVNVVVEGRRECRLFVEGAKCASTHGVLQVRTRSSARWMDESNGDQAFWCSPDVSLWKRRIDIDF